MKTLLIIAGNDPSGGAGLLADVKTSTLHGVFAMGVPTDLTIQNTQGVRNQYIISKEIILEQLRCVLDDQIPDAVKIGLIPDADSILAVADIIKEYNLRNVVLDPVMFPTLGKNFIDSPQIWREVMLSELIPLCEIITPNEDEAGKLLGEEIFSNNEPRLIGSEFLKIAKCPNILITNFPQIEDIKEYISTDILFTRIDDGIKIEHFSSPRVPTKNTHGTGCALSTSIASNLAQNMSVPEAIKHAKKFISGAIDRAKSDSMGKGHGPVYLLPQNNII